MRKIFILLVALTAILTTSCDKTSYGDAYEVTDPLPPYVAIASTDLIEASEGDEIEVSFQLRSAIQGDVQVFYNIAGAINMPEQTATIERNKTSVTVPIMVPEGVIVAPDTTAMALLTLTKATTADGKNLTIGQKADPETQKVEIVISD